jgi:hypothetical protein
VTRRWLLWAPLLAVAGWLALWGDKRPAGAAISLPPRPSPVATSPAAPMPATAVTPSTSALDNEWLPLVPRTQLVPIDGVAASTPRPDPFSARSWKPPSPTIAAATQHAPVAPPQPYAYLGKQWDGESWQVFLARGDQNFLVRQGQVLEGTWRVERLTPPGLALTHVPTGQVQDLAIGEAR